MPSRRSTPKMLHRAWELRQDPTRPGARLWAHLRTMREQGVHFRRQHAIGSYVADFCAPGQRLVIELDGSQHINQETRDRARTAFLNARGYRVIRFSNDQVAHDIRAVLQTIGRALGLT